MHRKPAQRFREASPENSKLTGIQSSTFVGSASDSLTAQVEEPIELRKAFCIVTVDIEREERHTAFNKCAHAFGQSVIIFVHDESLPGRQNLMDGLESSGNHRHSEAKSFKDDEALSFIVT